MDLSSSRRSPGPSSHRRPSHVQPQRRELHSHEVALLWIVSVHLIFLPWPLGSTVAWAQFVSLGLSLGGFVIALLPRDIIDENGPGLLRLYPWPKLLRFPLFWTGLLLLAYVAVQALNPAWLYVEQNRAWWMMSLPHVWWLPSGTQNPFDLGGPWRTLIVYASAWLLVCSMWVGFTRRRSVQLLTIVLVLNGAAFALFAVIQRLAGNGLMFWFWRSPNESFFGSFIYKNHAGAYLLLMLTLAVSLAAWFYFRGQRRMEKSGPAGACLFLAVVFSVDILVSYARGATLFSLGFLALALVTFLIFQIRQPSVARQPIIALVLFIGLVAFVRVGWTSFRAEKAVDRITHLFKTDDVSVTLRQQATTASWEMFTDNWKFGTGAGSFRFLFPIYQQTHPEIFTVKGKRLFWNHAHNDFVQFPLELGIGGVALIAFSGLFWLYRLLRSRVWANPFASLATLGLLTLLAHSWTDFLFQNPAILLTWCALWAAVTLWAGYEDAGGRGAEPVKR